MEKLGDSLGSFLTGSGGETKRSTQLILRWSSAYLPIAKASLALCLFAAS